MDLYSVRNLLASGKTIYDINLRVTFYARVSTDKDEQLNSLNNQIGYYKEFIDKCPNWTYAEGYYDEGISGTSAKKRENFLRMISDGKAGKFDLVITKEISRFSRNTLDSIKYTQELLASGVGVFFQNDNINTLHSDSELRLTIMSSIAQDEVRKLSERVKFGFRRSIADGKVLGNDNIYGYIKKDGKLIIESAEAKIVKRIFELYLTGVGLRAVGARLLDEGITNRNGREFSYSTIKRIISNPKYKGYYCGNKSHKVAYNLDTVKKLDSSQWVMYKDDENVPQIIDDAVWDRANEILQKRSREIKAKETSYTNKFAYSKKIYCGEHDTPYYHVLYKYKSGVKHIWQCKRYAQKGLAGCSLPIIYQDELDKLIGQIVTSLLPTENDIIRDLMNLFKSGQNDNNYKDKISSLDSQIEIVKKRKERLLDLNLDGIISKTEFKARNQKLDSEIEKLKAEIDAVHNNINERVLSGKAEKLKSDILKELKCNVKITTDLVESIVDKITVLKDSTKQNIKLEFSSKLFDEPRQFNITSFCSSLHT